MFVSIDKVLFYDSACGLPVVWLQDGHYNELSLEEATWKHGQVKSIERGPRGGFKSIIFEDGTRYLTKLKGIE